MLRTALHSVNNQNYPAIDLVVINDGGKDISESLDCFEIKGREIQLHQSSENLGRANAANLGLQNAKGEFIGFLDDDDYLEPDHIGNLVQSLTTTNMTVAYSGTRVDRISADGGVHHIKTYNTPYDATRLLFENYLPIHSVLFHRKYLQRGVQFDMAFDFFEDWDFWLQLSQQTDFLHRPDITAIYRLHPAASGVHKADRKSSAYLKIYKKWLSKFPIDETYGLLAKSHYWYDQEISNLQNENGEILDNIGAKHSYALEIVQNRDHQLAQCNEQLEALGKKHTHAQNVVRERDSQLEELNSQLKKIEERNPIKFSRIWPLFKKLMK